MEHRHRRETIEAQMGNYDPTNDSYRLGYQQVTSSASVSTCVMKVYDFVVEMIMVANYAVTVTLPPVAEARGKVYSIFCSTHGESSCSVTITDAGDDAIFSDVTLAYLNNYAILFSNGKRWFVLASHIVT